MHRQSYETEQNRISLQRWHPRAKELELTKNVGTLFPLLCFLSHYNCALASTRGKCVLFAAARSRSGELDCNKQNCEP